MTNHGDMDQTAEAIIRHMEAHPDTVLSPLMHHIVAEYRKKKAEAESDAIDLVLNKLLGEDQ